LMREGDEWELVIPANLAYGARGAGGGAIPPNQVLVFDLTLISVAEPPKEQQKDDQQ
jgi:FKBP-type peptidyl-prolyl cis-trans isomerase